MVRTKRLFVLLTAAFLATTALHTSIAQELADVEETVTPIQTIAADVTVETPTPTLECTEVCDSTETPIDADLVTSDEQPSPSPTQHCTIEPTPTDTIAQPTDEPTPAPTEIQQAPTVWEGLVSIPVGTTLYQDAQLQIPVCTLIQDGIAYQMPTTEPTEALLLIYTTDGLTLTEGYIPQTECTPLAAVPLVEAEESQPPFVLYCDCALTAVIVVPVQAEQTAVPSEPPAEPYEMLAYGFPGMPQGYELSAQELAAKERISTEGTTARMASMQAGVDYAQGYVLLIANTELYAQQVAASYNATLETYSFGVALLRLNGATVQAVIAAAADPLTRLVAVEPNYYRTLDAQLSNRVQSSGYEEQSLFSLPTAGVWADYQQGDPFLASPGSTTYQYIHDAINTWAAWGITTGSTDVYVAVLDSGINAAHEEFDSRVKGLTPLDPSASPIRDKSGHGTHVAGIIAGAMGNHCGGAGIAPDVSLLSYSIINPQGAISSLDIVYGLGMARTSGAWVIQISATGYVYSEAENEAVSACINQGIAVIAPAGDNGGMTHAYPANYAGVINVAATDQNSLRMPCSNYGSATLSAPGSGLLSASNQGSSAYATMDGTAVAAAVVTGTSALYYSARGTRDLNGDGATNRNDVELLKKRLCASCTKVSGSAKGMGAGIVNVGKLFSTLVAKPTISLVDKDGAPLQGTSAVPTTATVRIKGRYNHDYIVYTTNGSTPKVSGGSVTNGQSSSADVVLPLDAYPAGKVTIKALCVSAAGKASSVSSLSFTIDNRDKTQVQRIEIKRESLVCCAGNSVTLLAKVYPATKSLKPTWTIVSGSNFATLNAKTGKLYVYKKTPANSAVVVQATLGSIVQQAEVSILPRVKRLNGFETASPNRSVIGRTLTAYVGASETTNINLSLAFEGGSVITPEDGYIQASVAKPAYATATVQGGTVRLSGRKLGKTAVTLIPANDASKKLSFTLWVKKRVESIRLPGGNASSIAVGKSKTLTATVLPSNASDKRLSWSIEGTAPRGITLKGNKLSCARTATEGVSFTLRCKSTADPDRYATQVVTICRPTLSLRIRTDDPRATYTSKGIIKEVTLYTVPIDDTGYDRAAASSINETELLLSATGATGETLWSCSNTRIATVNAYGQISAVRAGTATITCSAIDGSNKKTSVTVRVIVPVSSIALSVNTSYASISSTMGDMPVLAMGKSLKLSAAYRNAYGTPSVKKAQWRITDVYYISGDAYTHITDAALAAGAVSITAATGQLRVKPYKGLKGYFVTVQATAADKSCTSPPYTLFVQPQTTKLTSMKGSFTIYDAVTGLKHKQSYASTITLKVNHTGVLYFYTDSAVDNYTITSSNSKVAAPYGAGAATALATRSERNCVLVTQKGKTTEYSLVELGVTATRPGTAKITVRTNDGTNKSCTFTVRVVK